MDARDEIPLETIEQAGSLHVPFTLSRTTAMRLERNGWVALEFAGTSAKGRSKYYLAYLTNEGRAALADARQ